MAGFTQAYAQTLLDLAFPTSGASEFIGYSTNGTTESTAVINARTPVGATGWASATAAQPSVKANGVQLTTAAAVGAGTITHYAVFTELTSGVQMIDWTPLGTSKTLAIGEVGTWAIGALAITLD